MAAERENPPGTTRPEAARKMPNRPLLLGGIVLLGAAFVLILFGSDLFGNPEPEAGVLDQVPQLSAGTLIPTVSSGGGPAPAVGEPAPNFTLSDLDGNETTLNELRGRPVIINFWATWCGPCQIEMPELQEAYEARREEDLAVLAVNREEDPDTVRAFFYDELELSFTPLLDSDLAVANLYQVFNLPTTYFVNESGTITGVHRGPLTESQIAQYLEN